jgi:site-specific DNA recombinase
MLTNTIYRGLFVLNGSAYSKAKAKREDKQLVTIDYLRPALRIVEDVIWFDCNQPEQSRVPRKGKKHLFSGLMSCGSFGVKLTGATGGSSPSLYCAQCSQAKQVGIPGHEGRYVSANGVKAVLVYVMERLFSDELREMFRERLRDRLSGGQEGRLAALKKDILRKERTATRLIQLVAEAETEDSLARLQYDKVTTEKLLLDAEMMGLEQEIVSKGSGPNTHNLDVNPTSLLPDLFSGAVQVERLRAMLRSMFTTIEVMGKPSQFSTEFRIEMAPEISIAGHLTTEDTDESKWRFNLKVTTGLKWPTSWLVTEC